MKRATPREVLRHMMAPRDKRIAQLEARIAADAKALAEIATDERFTFFWRQITNLMRSKGALLPGDGRGGLIKNASLSIQATEIGQAKYDHIRPAQRKS